MEEKSYLQQAIDYFISRREQGLMLAPADWLVAKRWEADDIPLAIVKEGIDSAVEAYKGRKHPPHNKGITLEYCDHSVRKKWRIFQQTQVGGIPKEEANTSIEKKLLSALPYLRENIIQGLQNSPMLKQNEKLQLTESFEALHQRLTNAVKQNPGRALRAYENLVDKFMTELAKMLTEYLKSADEVCLNQEVFNQLQEEQNTLPIDDYEYRRIELFYHKVLEHFGLELYDLHQVIDLGD